MEPAISRFSLEFRKVMLSILHDDFFVKNKSSRLDTAALEKYRSLINNINGFILICDYTTGIYEYISEGVYSNLGYDFANYTSEEATDFMISIIKPDHKEFFFSSVFMSVMEYLKNNVTPSSGTDYRYSCSMKIKNIYDVYQWFLVDTVVIEADATGLPLKTLITCTNIEAIKKDDFIYYNITKKNKDGVYEVVLEGTNDNRFDQLKLTARELQITNLISYGHTNKEIAEKLFISLNTVQTHRKNIMRKTNCSGTAELTNFAFARGLL